VPRAHQQEREADDPGNSTQGVWFENA